jgi:hypothetical protein
LHYYLALFPAVTILVAFLAWSLVSSIKIGAERPVPAVWSVVLLLPVIFAGVAFTIQKIHPGADLQTSQTVEFIQENTGQEDTVLMWGTQTVIYFLSGRESPTRYVHQIPLWNTRYATRERVEEFLNDLEDKKPALIIDTRLRSMPLVYQEGNSGACGQGKPDIPQGMERVYAFICGNYKPVDILGPDGWVVYRYNPAVHIDGKTGN